MKPLYAIDSDTLAAWSWTAMDGIPFYVLEGNGTNGNYINFKCPMEHGLVEGEFVELSFPYGTETIFQVTSLGTP